MQGTAKLHDVKVFLSRLVPGIFPDDPDGFEGSLRSFIAYISLSGHLLVRS